MENYPLIDYASNLALELSLRAEDVETHERLDSLRWKIFFTAYDSLE